MKIHITALKQLAHPLVIVVAHCETTLRLVKQLLVAQTESIRATLKNARLNFKWRMNMLVHYTPTANGERIHWYVYSFYPTIKLINESLDYSIM